jgi:branched-chain amino acid transport system permease protein
MVDSLGKTFFPDLAQYTLYVAFILALLFRPAGLFGRAQLVTPAPPPIGDDAARHGEPRAFAHPWQSWVARFGPLLAVVALFLVLPPIVPPYLRTLMTQILIYGIFALSLNLLFGYTGLFSLGHAAFFGVAAYTTAILSTRMDVTSFWLLLPAGVLAATLIAAVFGLIALRVSGVYFLFVTLALGELLVAVANDWVSQTGGSNGIFGIQYPSLLPGVSLNQVTMLYLTLVVFAVSATILWAITRSPFGLALQGIRDDEGRMRQLGYDTWRFKYLAFLIAGAFAGVAGVLFAPFSSTVAPSFLGAPISSLIMLMVILGSARLFWGPVLGAAIILFLQYYVSLVVPERWPLVLGLVFVVAVLLAPGGVGARLDRLWGRVRYAAPKPVARVSGKPAELDGV